MAVALVVLLAAMCCCDEEVQQMHTDWSQLCMLLQTVVGMASRGLRCIALTYTDYPAHDPSRPADFFEDADRVDHNLIVQAIVGIKDPVRLVQGVYLLCLWCLRVLTLSRPCYGNAAAARG